MYELGGINIYLFVANNCLNRCDILGLLDSDLQNYAKRNFTTEVKAFAGGGGGISLLLIRESGQHCCTTGIYEGQDKEIVEWTIGGQVSVGVGLGVDLKLFGVGIDFNITFASAELNVAATHVILDDCLDNVYARVDLLNIKASPGVKEASIGLGWLANATLSVYGGFELNLGAEISKSELSWYGGVYFDYDFSLSGSFLWRQYNGVGIDDVSQHQRVKLAEFGKTE